MHFFRRERTLIAPTQQVRGPESAKREYRPGAIKFQAVLRPNFCAPEISTGCGVLFHSCMLQQDDMVNTLRLLPGTVLRVFRARRALLLENLALRQQLVALRRRPRGPHAVRTWEGNTGRENSV